MTHVTSTNATEIGRGSLVHGIWKSLLVGLALTPLFWIINWPLPDHREVWWSSWQIVLFLGLAAWHYGVSYFGGKPKFSRGINNRWTDDLDKKNYVQGAGYFFYPIYEPFGEVDMRDRILPIPGDYLTKSDTAVSLPVSIIVGVENPIEIMLKEHGIHDADHACILGAKSALRSYLVDHNDIDIVKGIDQKPSGGSHTHRKSIEEAIINKIKEHGHGESHDDVIYRMYGQVVKEVVIGDPKLNQKIEDAFLDVRLEEIQRISESAEVTTFITLYGQMKTSTPDMNEKERTDRVLKLMKKDINISVEDKNISLKLDEASAKLIASILADKNISPAEASLLIERALMSLSSKKK